MIYIFRGDDTDFNDNQFIKFKVNSDTSTIGWKGVFQLGVLTYEFNNLSVENEIVITSEQSKKLPFGSVLGSFVLFDDEGRKRTLTNTIPFYVSNYVKSNKPQTFYLNTLDDNNVSVNIDIATLYLKAENLVAGNNINIQKNNGVCTIEALTPSVENFATKADSTSGLNKKQDKGDYALVSDVPTLVSELENDSNYATQTQVMQAIAAIPQFALSIVNELPETGAKMVLYLVPKEGADKDVYNEYIWIEQTSSFEFIGSTAVDLTDYVKKTDVATTTTLGLVTANPQLGYGLGVQKNGTLYTQMANKAQIDAKQSSYMPIVPATLDYAVKVGVTTNTNELTDEEKASAQTWLGLDNVVKNADFATQEKGGIVKIWASTDEDGNLGLNISTEV